MLFEKWLKIPGRFFTGRSNPPSQDLASFHLFSFVPSRVFFNKKTGIFFFSSMAFAFIFALPLATAQAQTFTNVTVSATSACVTTGQTVAVTAVFGPTNQQFETDDYSVGFGNASTILWPGGCTTAYNT